MDENWFMFPDPGFPSPSVGGGRPSANVWVRPHDQPRGHELPFQRREHPAPRPGPAPEDHRGLRGARGGAVDHVGAGGGPQEGGRLGPGRVRDVGDGAGAGAARAPGPTHPAGHGPQHQHSPLGRHQERHLIHSRSDIIEENGLPQSKRSCAQIDPPTCSFIRFPLPRILGYRDSPFVNCCEQSGFNFEVLWCRWVFARKCDSNTIPTFFIFIWMCHFLRGAYCSQRNLTVFSNNLNYWSNYWSKYWTTNSNVEYVAFDCNIFRYHCKPNGLWMGRYGMDGWTIWMYFLNSSVFHLNKMVLVFLRRGFRTGKIVW